ncbi:PKD domain-containing protein, partial [bacterium]|nr:PKD domain-containing protein [bacterium]
GDQVLTPELTAGREVSDYNGSHFPLFHNLIYMDVTDPGNVEYEIVPLREGFFHLNILKFLEVSPCTDCFEITNVTWPEPKVINVDFKITHPYDDPLYTIFDVRGIMMFKGGRKFPESLVRVSDPWYGDGVLLNPDGFTSLYNTWLIGTPAPPIQEYLQGVFATDVLPDAHVNGYIRHISVDPNNTRNALLAGDSVTRTYSLRYPAFEFVFGYAVDASWAVPINTPVDAPMTDFGPNANSPEPWKIVVTPFSEEMTYEGGTSWLQIDVYDRGGNETHDAPVVECLKLFNGERIAGFISETEDFARYHVSINNENLAPGGYHKCLISVQDSEYNPNFSWIDMKAFQVVDVRVAGRPVAVAHSEPNIQQVNQPVYFSGSGSYDPDGDDIISYEWDWENDGTYDSAGPVVDHAWPESGHYQVQLRVTDDNGNSDVLNNPLTVAIFGNGIPANPIEITPDWFNFRPEAIFIVDNLAYVTASPGSLNIYDISEPGNPMRLSKFDLPGILYRLSGDITERSILYVEDDYAYIYCKAPYPNWDKRILIVNISSAYQPYIVNHMEIDMSPTTFTAHEGYLYVGCDTCVRVFNVNPPEQVYEVWDHGMEGCEFMGETLPGTAESIGIIGDYAYVAEDARFICSDITHRLDISDPEHPTCIHETGGGDSLDVYKNYVLIQMGNIGIWEQDNNFHYLGYIDAPLSEDYRITVDPSGVAAAFKWDTSPVYIFDIEPILEGYLACQLDLVSNFFHGQNGVACNVNYDSIRIIDTDPPDTCSVLSEFHFPSYVNAMAKSDELLYLGTRYGVSIFDVDPLTNSHKIGELQFEEGIWELQYQDDLIYAMGQGQYGDVLRIINVANPQQPSTIISLSVPYTYDRNIYLSDGYAYVPGGGKDMSIIDIDPPQSVHIVNSISLDFDSNNIRTENIIVNGEYAYVTPRSFSSYLSIVDVDPPESAYLVNSIELPSSHSGRYRIDIKDNYLFIIATGLNGAYNNTGKLIIFDATSPVNPVQISILELQDDAHDIVCSGNYAYIASDSGIFTVDVSVPQNPFIVNTMITDHDVVDLELDGETIYAATQFGVQVFDLW